MVEKSDCTNSMRLSHSLQLHPLQNLPEDSLHHFPIILSEKRSISLLLSFAVRKLSVRLLCIEVHFCRP